MAGVLIVEDDRLVASAIARVVRNTPRHDGIRRGVLLARTAAAAREYVTRADSMIVAAIFDVKLPDGDGLELLAEFRKHHERVAVLVLTGHHDEAELSRRAFLLDASFVAKPVDPEIIRRFILGATTRRLIGDDRVGHVAQAWTRRYRLTARQSQLLASAVAEETPDTFRARTTMSRDRYKELVGELLAKCHRRNLGDVVNTVLREVIGVAKTNGESRAETMVEPKPRTTQH